MILDRNWGTKNSRLIGGKLVFRLEGSLFCVPANPDPLTVVFGSNTSTLKQTSVDMKAAEAHRTELISRMDLRVVGDRKVES